MDESRAVRFLESLLGKSLRVHTTDTRMFSGIFRCTDADQNVILSSTFEYRFPPREVVQNAAQDADKTVTTENPETVKLNMTSRLIGLVVIPGQHITRIELEEIP